MPEPSTRVRVMTWNIHGGVGLDGVRSTQRIGRAISESGADIICLQEVHQRLPWSGFADQPRTLRRILGLPVHFHACLKIGIGGYGLAIVSRFPVTGVRRHRLPSVGEQRGAMEAVVAIAGIPVRVFCTHWGLNGRERMRQAAALARIVGDGAGDALVCGDLNAAPDARCVRSLMEQAGLADAAANTTLATFPAQAPSAAIDYILHTASVDVHACRTIPTDASDHLPVIAELGAPTSVRGSDRDSP
jgi:endonuclease/exonuclease/phosphatase family metal-dependent hydrolase